MKKKQQIMEIADGEIVLWNEQGASVHIKAVSASGDPVELTSEEARTLAAHLLRLADEIE